MIFSIMIGGIPEATHNRNRVNHTALQNSHHPSGVGISVRNSVSVSAAGPSEDPGPDPRQHWLAGMPGPFSELTQCAVRVGRTATGEAGEIVFPELGG